MRVADAGFQASVAYHPILGIYLVVYRVVVVTVDPISQDSAGLFLRRGFLSSAVRMMRS